ncbi:ABC transporter substrate-binding protein [Candidatus Finniella inopinata]|uniref:SsuA/THI5-like domain-containing protein n=1 Tax=Candidatus Finniella inopinata TaxID=1696036 RepID=A0A4Q7DJL1_9PROT|nr:ABC transporter substrate-binding protein [Candidatus Finniella inopinata]RZI46932.1 hypothetical protein EQU50_01525 [Candidatus Finniella inopinata]
MVAKSFHLLASLFLNGAACGAVCKFLNQFFSWSTGQSLDTMRLWGPSYDPSQSALPASTHNTTLPVPPYLSILKHVFSQASKPVRIRLKSQNRSQDSTPGNSLTFKKEEKDFIYPLAHPADPGVTNHHIQNTMGMVYKLLTRKNFQILLVSIFLSSCDQQPPLRLTLDWVLNPHHAPLVIALTQGFFKEEGLQVDLIPAQGSLEGCIQVAASAADLALTTESQWIIQKDKGLDLEPVLTLISQPLEVFVSRVPLHQLKGKRIGHASSGVGFSAAVLRKILKNQGLTENDIIDVHTKHGLVAALVNHQVDAIVNAYRTYIAVDLKGHNGKFHIYPYEDLGIPVFAAQVMVANPRISSKTKQALQRALKKACQFIHQNPDEAWMIFKTHRPELDTAANQALWPLIGKMFNVDPLPVSEERHQTLKVFLRENGLIKKGELVQFTT